MKHLIYTNDYSKLPEAQVLRVVYDTTQKFVKIDGVENSSKTDSDSSKTDSESSSSSSASIYIDNKSTSLDTSKAFYEQGYLTIYELTDLSNNVSGDNPVNGKKYATSIITVYVDGTETVLATSYSFADQDCTYTTLYDSMKSYEEITDPSFLVGRDNSMYVTSIPGYNLKINIVSGSDNSEVSSTTIKLTEDNKSAITGIGWTDEDGKTPDGHYYVLSSTVDSNGNTVNGFDLMPSGGSEGNGYLLMFTNEYSSLSGVVGDITITIQQM